MIPHQDMGHGFCVSLSLSLSLPQLQSCRQNGLIGINPSMKTSTVFFTQILMLLPMPRAKDNPGGS
jgi:hypothetical protein